MIFFYPPQVRTQCIFLPDHVMVILVPNWSRSFWPLSMLLTTHRHVQTFYLGIPCEQTDRQTRPKSLPSHKCVAGWQYILKLTMIHKDSLESFVSMCVCLRSFIIVRLLLRLHLYLSIYSSFSLNRPFCQICQNCIRAK